MIDGRRKELAPAAAAAASPEAEAGQATKVATMVSVTISCDHRWGPTREGEREERETQCESERERVRASVRR